MATEGFGTTLSGATHGAIANIVSITPPGIEREPVDTTTHSATGGYATSIPSGLRRQPPTAITIMYDETVMTALKTRIEADAEVWTITFPDSSNWQCSGYITKLNTEAVEIEGVITQTLEFAWTGQPTWNQV